MRQCTGTGEATRSREIDHSADDHQLLTTRHDRDNHNLPQNIPDIHPGKKRPVPYRNTINMSKKYQEYTKSVIKLTNTELLFSLIFFH